MTYLMIKHNNKLQVYTTWRTVWPSGLPSRTGCGQVGATSQLIKFIRSVNKANNLTSQSIAQVNLGITQVNH